MTSPLDGKVAPFGQAVDKLHEFIHAPSADMETEAGPMPNLHKLNEEMRGAGIVGAVLKAKEDTLAAAQIAMTQGNVFASKVDGIAGTDRQEIFTVYPGGVDNLAHPSVFKHSDEDSAFLIWEVVDQEAIGNNSSLQQASIQSIATSLVDESQAREISDAGLGIAVQVAAAESAEANQKQDTAIAGIVAAGSATAASIAEESARSTRSDMASSLALHGVAASAADAYKKDQEREGGQISALHSMALLLAEGLGDAGSSAVLLPISGVYSFGTPSSIIRIDVETASPLPSSKGTVIGGTASVNVDGIAMQSFCNLEVQGASSATYPKKNWAIGFFSDEALEEEVQLKIGDVLPQEEWIFKANWIDSTHVRNVGCNRLWADVMASRNTWPFRDVEKKYVGETGLDALETGASGHVQGYPAVMFINGGFYGIGSFNIGKKRGNYNLPKNKPKQIMVEVNNWWSLADITTGLTKPYSDTTLIELKTPSAPTDDTAAAIAAWDTFASGDQASITAAIDSKLDKQNAIDFMLFAEFIAYTDGVQPNQNIVKNFHFITYDGAKWLFFPYDLDTSFGLHYAGTSISTLPTADVMYGTGNGIWKKFKNAFGSEMNERYAQLRNSGVFSVEHIYKIYRGISSFYCQPLYEAEQEKWPTLPSVEITGIDQVMTWVAARLEWMDTSYGYAS